MVDYRLCRPSFEVKKEEMCFKKNSYMRNAHYNKERQGGLFISLILTVTRESSFVNI